MWVLLRSLISKGRRNWRLLSFLALFLVGFGLLATILTVEATSQPKFCGSCHIMEPYYKSWLTSSHKDFACVECHIPPGIYSEIQKKTEAISMVASYFTGTYGTNPWAEVDDAACLQCHQRRLLAGKENYKGVIFDHEPHLSELRREKKLRCTSCHSQIVQGSHIAVETSTCFLCHFKDQASGKGTARCTLCHAVPEKVIEKGSLSFNHADVKRFDMQCQACHSHITSGEGTAPKQRCYVCHNDVTRLEKYDDHPALHRIHVSEHKVECLHCHTEILHGESAGPPKQNAGSCGVCHADGHSPQRDLYSGQGGKGVPERPSNMFLAGISCEGCHFVPRQKGADKIQSAGALACMACHGPRYAKMLDRWKGVLDERLALARRELTQAQGSLRAGCQALSDAEANLLLVERGHGVHNVDYALDVLAANHTLLNTALKQAGRSGLPGGDWERPAKQNECLRCHQGQETQSGSFDGKPFSHRPHVVGRKMDCLSCHRPHEQREPGEVVSMPAQECAPCHHTAAAKDQCSRCHAGITGKTLAFKGKKFSHQYHLEDEGLKCLDCHTLQERPGLKPKACADCHEDEGEDEE
ncbi:MAG: NapC/NirT family cytochrome c [Candidatus Latescibacteria bacterium]|nr:NapC/NirT family cytochrome c [Candidatus Latescibacterota bacterium]